MPTQRACQNCSRQRKSCDRQRPCQRCVKRGRNCEYLGDATPTLLLSTPQTRHVQRESYLQRGDAPDLVAATFPCKSANINENQISDRTTLPIIAGPNTYRSGITTQSASRSRTPQHHKEVENNTLNMDTVMADNTNFDARPNNVQVQPDESPWPIFKQHHNNGSNVMKSGEQDSKHELEDKLDSRNHCRPCKLSKKGCDKARPCLRCTQRGKPDECIPFQRNKEPTKTDSASVGTTKPNVEQEWVDNAAQTLLHSPRSDSEPWTKPTKTTQQAPSPKKAQEQRPQQSQNQQFAQFICPQSSQILSIDPNMAMPRQNSPSPRRNRGLYIIPLDELAPTGILAYQQAVMNQINLIRLRSHNPPARGPFPRVLIDPSWSHVSKKLPDTVNLLVHIPETEHGDFWGLYAAPSRQKMDLTAKEKRKKESVLEIGNPTRGDMLWALISTDLITMVKEIGGELKPPGWRLNPPTFLPGTRIYEVWNKAAEQWLGSYELPAGEAYVCKCRTPRAVGGKTIKCRAGEARCQFWECHLFCLGLSEEDRTGGDMDVEWWCPHCRVLYPEEAEKGGLSHGDNEDKDEDNGFGSEDGFGYCVDYFGEEEDDFGEEEDDFGEEEDDFGEEEDAFGEEGNYDGEVDFDAEAESRFLLG